MSNILIQVDLTNFCSEYINIKSIFFSRFRLNVCKYVQIVSSFVSILPDVIKLLLIFLLCISDYIYINFNFLKVLSHFTSNFLKLF
jgi:hypothetical protein